MIMMLEKTETIDRIEILEQGQIQIRTLISITEDGNELSRTYHRRMITPGTNVDNEDARIQAIANTLWTPIS